MLIDLTQGYGEFSTHKLFQFPDGSIKFELSVYIDPNDSFRGDTIVKTRLRSHEDIFTLALVKDVLDRRLPTQTHRVKIDYMMYQQDDRLFDVKESFGLKVVCKFINDMKWDEVIVFAPHSDKVEFIDKIRIVDNTTFVAHALTKIPDSSQAIWVIPDSGAFKTQFKMIQKMDHDCSLVCSKSRDDMGRITTVVPKGDLEGHVCFIVDDICLGGATFIAIAEKLAAQNCGKLYLIVSHGVFNKGVDHLFHCFDGIYTTDSICTLESDGNLKVFKI
jgi:ribose-phosphate pyrophosphokinase